MPDEREDLLDCLARWLLGLPREQAVATWRKWQDRGTAASKSPEFLSDMRRRLDKHRQGQT